MGTPTKQHCSQLAGNNWILNVTDEGDYITASCDRIQIVLLWEILQELRALNHANTARELRAIKRELATLRKIAEAKP